MGNKGLRVVITALVIASIILGMSIIVNADSYDPWKIESTAYCCGEICADGTRPIQGLTLAGKREWLGKSAVLYLVDENGEIGDCIGVFEFRDTGGNAKLKSGECIDIYMNNYDDCIRWGRRNIYIQIIDAKG